MPVLASLNISKNNLSNFGEDTSGVIALIEALKVVCYFRPHRTKWSFEIVQGMKRMSKLDASANRISAEQEAEIKEICDAQSISYTPTEGQVNYDRR